MNTPTHLIIGAAAFAKPGAPFVTACALAGAFIPDLSLYLMAGWHLMVLGTSPNIVFGELYYSQAWQAIFAVDNSFILWGMLLGAAIYLKKAWMIALTGAAFLHLVFDFPLHNHDARQHFWPITDWVFISPLSYWDEKYHGDTVSYVELALSLVLLAVLWRRFRAVWPRVAISAATLVQIIPPVLRVFVFGP